MSLSNVLKILSIAMLAFIVSGCSVPSKQTGSDSMAPPSASQNTVAVQPPEASAPPANKTEQTITDQILPEPPVVSVQNSPRPATAQLSPADQEFIQNRLNEYQNKLDQWVKISGADRMGQLTEELSARSIECVQLMERILSGYGLLLEKTAPDETAPGTAAPAGALGGIQQLDITFLESQCEEILTTDIPAQNTLAHPEERRYSFDEFQKIIISYADNENYQEAINWYSNLLRNYPDRKPDITTRLDYGLALQYSGQINAAARHFGEMLDSDDLAVESLSLQLKIADLFLASGDIATAKSYYEGFIQAEKAVEAEKSWAVTQLDFLRTVDPGSEDMLAYTKLLREFQQYDYRIHGAEMNEKINSFAREHAGSPVAVSALRFKDFTDQQLNSWFGRQLVKIDKLVAEKKFNAATDILQNMTNYYLPADLQVVVQKTYYDVSQAEMHETETRQRMQEMEMNQKWETAVQLMDSQRYGDAISAFEMLKGTDYEDKAARKIVEAANLAAGSMRKEAASLFIQAGKTPDIEKKNELLRNSHRLLTEILTKFPQTDLLDKVQQNIVILEEQIRKIDPALLEEIRETGASEMTEESPVEERPSNRKIYTGTN